MNGELAQNIALIIYGNEFLLSSQKDAPELFPSNSTFQYVSDISFFREKTAFDIFRKNEAVATDTRSWFVSLKTAGIKKLRLSLVELNQELPKHIAAAFAGGGNWVIQANSEKKGELWSAKWSAKIENRHDPQHRIWSVQYYKTPNHLAQINFPEIYDASKKLKEILIDIKTFAESIRLKSWGKIFAEATDLLSHSAPVIPYHPDLFPSSYQNLICRQLIASACKAWVFGGMGSWNDLGFEDNSLQKEYESVTLRLYETVINAIGAATNSTAVN